MDAIEFLKTGIITLLILSPCAKNEGYNKPIEDKYHLSKLEYLR